MRSILYFGLILWMLVGAPAMAQHSGSGVYDLLFKTGTLDTIAKTQTLTYSREVINTADAAKAAEDTGMVALSFEDGPALTATLQFEQGGKHRNLGSFPASVGNPIIMYFVETVVRDMAKTTGGSPFYIRNRVKEALISFAEVEGRETDFEGQKIAANAVTLRPFRNDPNAAQMQGFANLALTVTMSDAVPGWYQTFEAVVPGPVENAPTYSSVLRFKGMREAK